MKAYRWKPGLFASVVGLALLGGQRDAGAQCPGQGDCCSANGTPGCGNFACCLEVCATDPFCCDVIWDSLCASVANGTCGVCGAGCPGDGNCCSANGTPGCDNVGCCVQVCASDPYCCDTEWDETCALAAQGMCPPCSSGCPGGGDCCFDNGTPGCEDEACCELVCDLDPFCCTSMWDGVCAGHALDLCLVCQPECVDPFLDQSGTLVTPGEAFPGDEITVVYTVTNDGECVTDLLLACSIEPVSGGGPITSPQCDEVVTIAPLATAVFSRCFSLPSPAVPGLYEVCYEIGEPGGEAFDAFCSDDLTIRSQGDITGDGEIGMVDLFILLESWGPCDDCANCPADLDGDCEVGIIDLLILLGNWE
jgi:hypothetical protein